MRVKRIFERLVIIFLCLITTGFLFRNMVLHKAIDYVADNLKRKMSLELKINNSHFSGLSTIHFTGLSVVPLTESSPTDTLLHIDSLEVTPSLSSLILLHLKLNSVSLNHGHITFSCNDSGCNYSNLIHHTSSLPEEHTEKNYAATIRKAFVRAFDLTPQSIHITDLQLSYKSDSANAELNLPYFNSEKESMQGQLDDMVKNKQWKIEGSFSQSKRKFYVKLFPLEDYSRFPLTDQLFRTAIGFDTLEISLERNSYSKNIFQLSGNISSTGFYAYNKRLSNDTIETGNWSFDYMLNIKANALEVDSSSLFTLNKLVIHPYACYTSDTSKEYALNLRTDTASANDFFHSLPSGMFDETRDIQAEGKLQYDLHFRLNSAQPDSVEFESNMRKEKFGITKMGQENLTRINDEFQYTAYEHDLPFRTFMVGPSNPDYTPLEQISINLRNAILTSEDGSFFFHNGFNEDAFRKSIAEDYRKGSFARGGSTISMQLVKNVFLTRHKTIARKAEEALITWLIESNRLVSKERMFEVYLNIIELGPNIYGVGEAARFYFNKKPSELTLSESIFLASILPRPKWFKYSFDEQGNLKPYLEAYYRVVSNFLLKKNLITQEQYDEIQPNVILKGRAKEMVVPTDTIPAEEPE